MQLPKNFYAVILAGGGGTRLWPKSRQKNPKHLLKLLGKTSMLQMTYDRIKSLIDQSRILIITHQNHLLEAKKQLPKFPSENFIVEPLAKNTALAMATASAFVLKKDPQGVVINLAADHLIEKEEEFHKVVTQALNIASRTNYIVSIGIKPTYPHTGLGYIRVGEQLEDEKSFVFKVKGFKEKPDLSTAQSFLASNQYLWNANLYCWSVKTIFTALKEHSPEIFQASQEILQSIGTNKEQEIIERVYQRSENIQIDVAVSEKAKNLVVVPGDFGWSDIGDWKVIYDNQKKDLQGNVIFEGTDYLGIDTRDSLIEGDGRLIVAIGLQDVVIVDTGEVILICNKNRTQEVKKVVEILKQNNKGKYL